MNEGHRYLPSKRAVIVTVILALMVGRVVSDPYWSETYESLLVRGVQYIGQGAAPDTTMTGGGDLFVMDDVEVNGDTRLDGLVTQNSTYTAEGVIVANSRQIGIIPWTTAYDPINDDGYEVTGVAMPNTNYMVILQPTANITPIQITVIDSNSFSVELQAAPSADITQRYLIVPTDQSL